MQIHTARLEKSKTIETVIKQLFSTYKIETDELLLVRRKDPINYINQKIILQVQDK